MSNYASGKDYEDYIETVYKTILEAEKLDGQVRHITLERRKKIKSKSGTLAEIDIYWEYTLAGITNAVAIECRNYNKNVDIPGVRDFARKISDISGLKGLMVTKKGFSKNAVDEASADNIDLKVIREPKDEDWEGRLKTIDIRWIINHLPQIVAISPRLNKQWALENGYSKTKQIQVNITNDQLVFEDSANNFRYSLLDLQKNHFFEQKPAGTHEWKKIFNDGWMIVGKDAYKLDDVTIKYSRTDPEYIEDSMDLTANIIAIMEHISSNNRKSVILKNGEERDY